ncbi:hypothetical protein NPIL_672151 [Nephila pilipes]|uniref:Uncharacterized protein n=1 Tax=Nephila pilipes TaxID=299642 RepID=A0A8X6NST1_NEPPI|nr:hypothetical protein NPIL_672151 [Nephila pilipes]
MHLFGRLGVTGTSRGLWSPPTYSRVKRNFRGSFASQAVMRVNGVEKQVSEIAAARQTSLGTRVSFCALQQGGLCFRETPSALRPTASLLAPPEVATPGESSAAIS